MLAIKGGKIFTISDQVIKDGSILIDNGVIKEVGKNIKIPSNARYIDATNKVIMPGLIDAHSHIGLLSEPSVISNVNHNEMSSPITPGVRGIDSFNPFDIAFQDALAAGITAAWTQPGSANIIGGTGFVTKTWASRPDKMALKDTEQLAVALGDNPIKFHGRKTGGSPQSKMGTAMLLRKTLENVCLKVEKNKELSFDEKVLKKLLEGKLVARFHVLKADDILTAIRISQEFNLKFTLETVIEGYKVVEQIKEAGAPCVLGPFTTGRSSMEYKNLSPKNAGELSKKGVEVAFQCAGASETQWLPIQAGLAVREGMSEKTALRGLTLTAAEILGVSDFIGSIEKGKDADIAIFSGNPLSTLTSCEVVVVNGKIAYENKTYKEVT